MDSSAGGFFAQAGLLSVKERFAALGHKLYAPVNVATASGAGAEPFAHVEEEQKGSGARWTLKERLEPAAVRETIRRQVSA